MNKELKLYIGLINKNFEVLKTNFSVKKIAIFGSTARGDRTKKSDIDIIVELKSPISLFHFIELENFLGKILGKKVDLATKASLKQPIRKSILKEAVYA